MSTDKKSIASTSTAKAGKAGKGGKAKKGKAGTYLAIGSTLFAAFSNIKKVRAARGDDDTLQLVDGLIRVAAVATGVALLIRELRQHDDDVLAD